jgi:hypothetical protein
MILLKALDRWILQEGSETLTSDISIPLICWITDVRVSPRSKTSHKSTKRKALNRTRLNLGDLPFWPVHARLFQREISSGASIHFLNSRLHALVWRLSLITTWNSRLLPGSLCFSSFLWWKINMNSKIWLEGKSTFRRISFAQIPDNYLRTQWEI